MEARKTREPPSLKVDQFYTSGGVDFSGIRGSRDLRNLETAFCRELYNQPSITQSKT
jgi:hypothetical protein